MFLVRPTTSHQLRFFDGAMNYRPSLSVPSDKFQCADETSLKNTLAQLRFGWPSVQGQQLEQTLIFSTDFRKIFKYHIP
jgi:hypothetical protein